MMLSTPSTASFCSSEHFEEKHLTTPDEGSLQNPDEKSSRRQKNPRRYHNVLHTECAILARRPIF